MGITEPPGGLNCQIKNPPLHLLRLPFIQGTVPDPVTEASAVHPLRKDRRHAADLTDVIARHDVRMQPQIDPVLAFRHKFFLAAL